MYVLEDIYQINGKCTVFCLLLYSTMYRLESTFPCINMTRKALKTTSMNGVQWHKSYIYACIKNEKDALSVLYMSIPIEAAVMDSAR